ncbi:MAG: hypothetical protein KDA44_22560 [Planctomycetales bacterium]|nr:hypothetical protein [Planctomycetales bacterium]
MSAAEASVPPAVPRRSIVRRLHWLTWLALLAATVLVVLLEIPGFEVKSTLLRQQPFMRGGAAFAGSPNSKTAKGPLTVNEFIHGWPLTFCRRACGYGGQGWTRTRNGSQFFESIDGVPWNKHAAWSFAYDRHQWSLGALSADLLIAVGVVAFTGVAVQTWIRRRGGRVRFRIVDFLAVTTAVAVIAGWFQYQISRRAREDAVVALYSPAPADQQTGLRAEWQYRGPHWLERLAPAAYLDPCRQVTSVTIVNRGDDDIQWDRLAALSEVECLDHFGRLTPSLIDALVALPRLREVRVSNLLRGLVPSRPVYPQPVITSADELLEIRRLDNLQTLAIDDWEVLIEDVELIADMPSLTRLDLNHISATAAEIEQFRLDHPRLTVLPAPGQPSIRSLTRSRLSSPDKLLRFIACCRLQRWRWEDSKRVDPVWRQDGHLELRGTRLTDQRIDLLRNILGRTSDLVVDEKVSADQIRKLVDAAPLLVNLEADAAAATDGLLDALAQRDSLQLLSIRQGDATVAGFMQLRELPNLNILDVFQSTLTLDETDRLRSELADASVSFYRGANSQSEEIFHRPAPGDENPFGF